MSAYTYQGTAEAEARVEADLTRIKEAVRDLPHSAPLLAVYLLGGYARGEGVVIEGPDGGPRGFNDYDLLLVFRDRPLDSGPYRSLARDLARELEIDFVDLGLAGLRDLRFPPPTLFWYEFGEAHRLLWRAPEFHEDPRILSREELDPTEGSRLLLNRGLALLWAGLRMDLDASSPRPPDAADRRFATIASMKAILAAGDARLLRSGTYAPRQTERSRILAGANCGALGEAYGEAAAWRRSPRDLEHDAVVDLWWRSRDVHERAYRDEEMTRLGEWGSGWSGYPRRVRSEVVRDRWRHPRRWIRSLLGEQDPEEREARDRMQFPGLLYTPRRGRPLPPGWRAEAESLVATWHP